MQATVTGIDSHSLTLSKAFPGAEAPEQKLPFDYLVYALGSHLPEPIDLWGSASLGSVKYDGTKPKGIEFLKSAQKQVEAAPSVLVVGGGALGIRRFPGCFAWPLLTISQNMQLISLMHILTSA